MPLAARAAIVLNESSRGALAVGRDALEKACARAGLEARVIRVGHGGVTAAAERAAADSDVLIAAGGDGTVSSVAAAAVNANVTFGVIPLGTLNHFARDARIPGSVDSALRVIVAGHTKLLDVGEVNGAIFLNNASLGMYPRLVWERHVQEMHGRGRWTAFGIAVARSWHRYRTFDVRLAVNGESFARRTPFVFIGNGEYRIEGLELGTRRSIDAERLSVFVAPDCNRVEALALPFRALVNRLPARGGVEAFFTTDVTVHIDGSEVAIALDGELMLATPPFRCTLRARSLCTLVPEDD